MGTTREDIMSWWEHGKHEKATHMIVVCDTFDYEDYPVFVTAEQDVKALVAEYSDPSKMSRVIEVYSYKRPFAAQVQEHRAWHLD